MKLPKKTLLLFVSYYIMGALKILNKLEAGHVRKKDHFNI